MAAHVPECQKRDQLTLHCGRKVGNVIPIEESASPCRVVDLA